MMAFDSNEVAKSVSEEQITQLVHRFYDRVREDKELSAVFEAVIPADKWPQHLALMAEFWSSIMLGSGRYHGKPMQAHMRHLALIQPEMFINWLGLWSQTCKELLVPELAEAMLGKAENIAKSLQFSLFGIYQDIPRSAANLPVSASLTTGMH
ncbi:group III truncated hemoglobin [Undibacterium rugosum]|uniref:group III truncated hemoglobin n=1 Tax=Undibacterium rugosum TaxID=2762291 RepID=UPI001B833CB9|nr:group III truncated hemoglobin [Undibacterium rugosum]MBR7779405.1 group III truncated hemoglobin [Undibacterium rugosum]